MKNIILAFLTFISANYIYAGIKEDALQVMKLREEVEALSLEVESQKKSNQAEVDVYIQRQQEVETSLLKEKFKTDQLLEQIKIGKGKIERLSKNNKAILVDNFLTKLWKSYEESLKRANPVFATKLNERLQKLKFDYINRKISYEHALLHTWFLFEDDIKFSKEAEFSISSLTIDNKTHQVEMVRLGRNMAYIRTAEGQYAKMVTKPTIMLEYYSDNNSIENIETLIKQFKLQNKTGIYNLPGLNL